MESSDLRHEMDTLIRPLERSLARVCLSGLLGEQLQLRYSLCGVATASLQRYLWDTRGIETSRVIRPIPALPATSQVPHAFERAAAHVTLRHNDLMIDPTYSQFFAYAGLRVHDAMRDPAYMSHYPAQKIAVVGDENIPAFCAQLSARAGRLARELPTPSAPHRLVYPDGVFRETDEADIRHFFQNLYDPDTESPFPYVAESGDVVSQVVAHMHQVQ